LDVFRLHRFFWPLRLAPFCQLLFGLGLDQFTEMV
jgi:hypothetical protein